MGSFPHLAEESTSLFPCKPPTPIHQRLIAIILLGAITGGVGWYAVDRTLAPLHIALWLFLSIIGVGVFVWLVMDNPLLAIGIDEAGITLIRARGPRGGKRTLAWSEIEACRWQEYPIVNMHTTIWCLLIRAQGETFELTPEFDADTQERFADTLEQELSERDIPEASRSLPSFTRMLSQAGAWVFGLSIVGMLIAHWLIYPTLGTIFGLAFMFTGTVLALLTHREHLSKVILVLTIVLIVGVGVLIRLNHINLRETLNGWEQKERQLHHAPWGDAKPASKPTA